MTPAHTYRVDVRILALGVAGELLAGQMAGGELTAAEYDACDAQALTERVTKPATYAAKHDLDRKLEEA